MPQTKTAACSNKHQWKEVCMKYQGICEIFSFFLNKDVNDNILRNIMEKENEIYR